MNKRRKLTDAEKAERRKQDKATAKYILKRIRGYWVSYIEVAAIIILLSWLGFSDLGAMIVMILFGVIVGAETTLWYIRSGLIKNGINPETLKYEINKDNGVNG